TSNGDSESRFFKEADHYISTLKEKYREKTVITKRSHDDILIALRMDRGVMTPRLQIDLIDMRSRPDIIVSKDFVCSWILNCKDHFSKFTWAFPLKAKSPEEVVIHLRMLFFTFGPCRLLHSDNGREFVNKLVVDLKNLFPNMFIVHGLPRNPKCQGFVERANAVLCASLGKWLSSTGSLHWSESLMPVVYGINTRVAGGTKCTSYEVMFGQKPRSDCVFWDNIRVVGVVEHDDLPKDIHEMIQNAENIEDDQNVASSSNFTDHEVVADIASLPSLYNPSNIVIINTNPVPNDLNIVSGTIVVDPTQEIRKFAAENYLNEANKRQKTYDDHMKNLSVVYHVGDCVGVRIDKVDRTNTDPR
ncbi:unnamed protein product, partial [Didymodactylos carnosus]